MQCHRFRENHLLSLFYSFYWKTNYNKNYLLLLVEQIFRLLEIAFGNCLLLCVATVFCLVEISCKCKTLFELIITEFLASEIHSFQFFQILMPPKRTFLYGENIFFNKSFISWSGHFCLSSRNSILLFRVFFCWWTQFLKLGVSRFLLIFSIPNSGRGFSG